jgi:Heterokaryon incompatibility protein (HET)
MPYLKGSPVVQNDTRKLSVVGSGQQCGPPANPEGLGTIHAPEDFRYEKIELPAHIRLLELDPLPPDASNESWIPTCKLKLTDLRRKPVPIYTALSYNWGSDNQHSTIEVDGKALRVRSNVAEMLRLLARHAQSRTLWIDSICIWQDSIDERNSQVRLMGEIYAGANYILSWLCPHRGDLAAQFETLSRLLAMYSLNHCERDQILDLVDGLLQHPYWTRRWIVQEVDLARSVFLVTPGNAGQIEQLPMSFLGVFFDKVKGVFSLHDADFDEIRSCLAKELLLSRDRESASGVPLRELLITYRDTKCSDVRDKVFALAAMSARARKHLKFDYSAEPVEILLLVVAFALEHDGLLPEDIVGFTHLLKEQLHLGWTELRQALKTLQPSSPSSLSQLKEVTLLQCGVVSKGNRLEMKGEDFAHRYRDAAPALRRLPARTLQWVVSPELLRFSGNENVLSNVSPSEDRRLALSGQDLCAFTFDVSPSNLGTAETYQHQAGLATCMIESGDQVWQFPDTPVALIARSVGELIELCGRAFLLKYPTDQTSARHKQKTLPWDQVVDTCSKTTKRLDKRRLCLNRETLLDVLEWADYDSHVP